MKKTQRTDALRTIRRRWVSWLSIIVIAMLAVTAFLGITFSARSMEDSAGACYEAQQYADIELITSGLFSAKDLEEIRNTEGVAGAEGLLAIPSRVGSGDLVRDVNLQTGTAGISVPEWIDGREPEAPDECAVEEILAREMGWNTGDTFELAARDPRADMAIREKTLRITGIFTTAEHLTDMIHAEWLIRVTPEAFRTGLPGSGQFNRILIRISNASADRFSAAYGEELDRVLEALPTDGKWVVTDLRKDVNYQFIRENAENLQDISYTFSMLFVVIAMLVIYASIGRMVEQDGELVGAEKAMGLKNSEVLAKYLFYGVSATAAGAVLGILAAYFGMLRFVLMGFGEVFLFGERVYSFLPAHTALLSAGMTALSAAAVWLGCRRLLRSSAVTLMHGTAPEVRQAEKGKAAGRSLYTRLIFRNMRTDLKRVIVTVVSIGGCCALLVIGFFMRYAVTRVTEQQYGRVMHYDLEAAADPSAYAEAEKEAGAQLEGAGIPYAGAWTLNTAAEAGGELYGIRLICMDAERVPEFFTLKNPETGEALPLPDTGILIPGQIMDAAGLRAGDTMTVYSPAMEAREVVIAGAFDNYLELPVLCGPETAAQILGSPADPNTILIRSEGRGADSIRELLKGVDGIQSLSSSESFREMFDGFSTILNLVILLMGALAVMIACFILLNLVNTYVTNKTRELTIMRINGFTTRETIRYASLESYGTTLGGILLGLGAGWLIGDVTCRVLNQPFLRLYREFHWVIIAAPALITAVISHAIHYFSFRKIRNLKMQDIR